MSFEKKGSQAQWVESDQILEQAKSVSTSSGAFYNAARLLAKREGHVEDALILEDIAMKHGTKIQGRSKAPAAVQGMIIDVL